MGSVYKLTDGDMCYYGSTKDPLWKRLKAHKYMGNCCRSSQLNRDKLEIIEVERVDDLEELLVRERYYIENNECINYKMPYATNEDKRIQSLKSYYKNKEQQNNYRLQSVKCKCGFSYTISNKKRHEQSKRHINNI